MSVLVTGVAGFIGFHLAAALLRAGQRVVGIDNLNDYYDPALKRARLAALPKGDFRFIEADLAEAAGVRAALAGEGPFEAIVNLAAQAGVRYSLEHPEAYVRSNIQGFLTVLELARHSEQPVHLVYASSSSVYGANKKLPFAVGDPTDRPVSFYGATKKANEAMAYSYSSLYGIPATGLRFFTVYGPWGRPDMAPWLFADAIFAGRPIRLFNRGEMARDFSYIDDVIAGVMAAIARPPAADEAGVRHTLYNLGNSRQEPLRRFLSVMEQAAGRTAIIEELPMQAGDVTATHADIADSRRDLGYDPATPIDEGVPRFIDWFRQYKGV
ncbi:MULTISPECIES: NAD-dependent epimerase/dehydratase family protein [Oceanibaculum]|uniref:NAD-dependent epimerase/dehydratase n=1 Tax=Oceanibaculum indicum P24 TaxID=1207063 RepID=K2JPI3_9PROT|nr:MULTISPECIES: NAD-dependent epimerase/dehydratase family protein [Oceanibaculum]EKE76462.1 NAD-dependent epimerase/dehydratase [Oceanibaculum indicum P24]MCH2393124.1 NAD-dependent epimerase/dehydratase family protein [Oceanibaculum sp.]